MKGSVQSRFTERRFGRHGADRCASRRISLPEREQKDNNRWYVRQNIRVTDSKEANEKALDLLDKGVTSLGFKVPAKELNATFISTLLEGIKADAVELNFSTCQGHTVELARLLTAYYDEKDMTAPHW